MTNLKIGLATLGLAIATTPAAFAQTDTEAEAALMKELSTEGVVTSAATCEYEGGSVMDLTDGKICFIPVRGVAANTKVYDGKGLGVMRCAGNGAFANELVEPGGAYCRVYLEAKKAKKTREELEAEARAAMEAELARQQEEMVVN